MGNHNENSLYYVRVPVVGLPLTYRELYQLHQISPSRKPLYSIRFRGVGSRGESNVCDKQQRHSSAFSF